MAQGIQQVGYKALTPAQSRQCQAPDQGGSPELLQPIRHPGGEFSYPNTAPSRGAWGGRLPLASRPSKGLQGLLERCSVDREFLHFGRIGDVSQSQGLPFPCRGTLSTDVLHVGAVCGHSRAGQAHRSCRACGCSLTRKAQAVRTRTASSETSVSPQLP